MSKTTPISGHIYRARQRRLELAAHIASRAHVVAPPELTPAKIRARVEAGLLPELHPSDVPGAPPKKLFRTHPSGVNRVRRRNRARQQQKLDVAERRWVFEDRETEALLLLRSMEREDAEKLLADDAEDVGYADVTPADHVGIDSPIGGE